MVFNWPVRNRFWLVDIKPMKATSEIVWRCGTNGWTYFKIWGQIIGSHPTSSFWLTQVRIFSVDFRLFFSNFRYLYPTSDSAVLRSIRSRQKESFCQWVARIRFWKWFQLATGTRSRSRSYCESPIKIIVLWWSPIWMIMARSRVKGTVKTKVDVPSYH